MSIERKDAKLIDNTPPSISYDAKTQSICAAWDRQALEVIDEIDSIILLPNLDKIVDPRLLDLLAWQLHVDFYEPDLPIDIRRELVRKSLQWHLYKGTPWVIRDILQTVFSEGYILEWWEYNPKPHADWHDAYKFKIITSSGSADPTVLRRLLAAIYSVKPASRWLEEFLIAKPTLLELWEASVTVRRRSLTVFLMDRPTTSAQDIFVGMAICHRVWIHIFASE